MNGFRSSRRQRNQRCRNKVNVLNFSLRNKSKTKDTGSERGVLNSILTRLNYIEKKLGLQLKNEG